MEPRLDTAFESVGGFSEQMTGAPIIHGRLHYDPKDGVTVELVENPRPRQLLGGAGAPALEYMFGRLADGTPVTLADCFISNASIQIGAGIGSPTSLLATRALFGHHTADIDSLSVKRYWLELSSLSNWTCAQPGIVKYAFDGQRMIGFDIECRKPPKIRVALPNQPFDIEISHRINVQQQAGKLIVDWGAAIAIVAHDALPLNDAADFAGQCHSLMSLLVGAPLSVRSAFVNKAHPEAKDVTGVVEHGEIADLAYSIYENRHSTAGDALSDWFQAENSLRGERTRSLHLLYSQIGRVDEKDVNPAMMLLPYGLRACYELLPRSTILGG